MKKKFLLAVSFLLLTKLCFSAPSTSISIPNSFSPNTTISSSQVNANFNEGQTEFNSHSHTDITQVGTITSGTWQGTAIDELYGGTGIATYTTGDIFYSSASNTLSKLGIGSASQHLIISGGIPAWSNAIDANSGTIDGVTIGASVAPTTTNIGTIAAGVWNGTDIAAGYGGIGSMKIDSGTVSATGAVSFSFTFGSAPRVFTSLNQDVAEGNNPSCTVVTTTGFTLGNAGEYSRFWIAYGAE